MKIEFFLCIFEKKNPNNKFHENPSRGSRGVPYGRTDMKQTVDLHNFAKAPKNSKRNNVKGSFGWNFLRRHQCLEAFGGTAAAEKRWLLAHLFIYLHTYRPTYLPM